MNLTYINLEIIFLGDNDSYQITQNEFKDLTVVEQINSLPSLDILLNLKSEELFSKIKDSKNIAFALGIHYENMDIMTCEVVSFKTMELSKSRNVVVKAIFSTEEFNRIRRKKTYIDTKPTDILKSLQSIKVDTVDLGKNDTFFQLNISDWDFLSKIWTPYTLSETDGLPLLAVAKSAKLVVRDSSKEVPVAYKLSPDGDNGSLAYVNIDNDTLFDADRYRDYRATNLVHSSYKETVVQTLSDKLPYWDMPLVIDNGNCSIDHYKAPSINKIRMADSQVVNVAMIGGNCPISILDYVDMESHETKLSGKYYVTKVTTKIGVGMNVSLQLRRFN